MKIVRWEKESHIRLSAEGKTEQVNDTCKPTKGMPLFQGLTSQRLQINYKIKFKIQLFVYFPTSQLRITTNSKK